MSSINFLRTELAAAVARGVRQCVVIGSRTAFGEAFEGDSSHSLRVFAIDEEQPGDPRDTMFVPEKFQSEPLAATLDRSEFDKLKASLFVWLGDAKYRTVDAAMTSLAFIASLPRGTGVVLDYAERTHMEAPSHTALEAMSSRVTCAGDHVKGLIQPQAVTAMLRGLGFQTIVDLVREELPSGSRHLVSATI